MEKKTFSKLCSGLVSAGGVVMMAFWQWLSVICVVLGIIGLIFTFFFWDKVFGKTKGDGTLIPKLNIDAKVSKIETSGYYDNAFNGHLEGDKQVCIHIILYPSKPMTINVWSLKILDYRFDAKSIIPEIKSIYKSEIADVIFNVPKDIAFGNKEAYIHILADGIEHTSDSFIIDFDEAKS